MVVDYLSDHHPMYTDDLVSLRREILQVKLATVLHKYHLSERNGHSEDPLTAMFDWIQVHAKGYEEQFYGAYSRIMEVCDHLCPGDCRLRGKAREIAERPETIGGCPFPFDILHMLLRDGYPIDGRQVGATYRDIVGREIPSGPE